mgnify:CR=1 FL=1
MSALFHLRLKELRKRYDLSQKGLAEMLDVTLGAVGNWEVGNRNPDFDMLIKISKCFNVSIDWLLGNDDELPSDSSLWIESLMNIGIDLADIENMTDEQKNTLLTIYKSFADKK